MLLLASQGGLCSLEFVTVQFTGGDNRLNPVRDMDACPVLFRVCASLSAHSPPGQIIVSNIWKIHSFKNSSWIGIYQWSWSMKAEREWELIIYFIVAIILENLHNVFVVEFKFQCAAVIGNMIWERSDVVMFWNGATFLGKRLACKSLEIVNIPNEKLYFTRWCVRKEPGELSGTAQGYGPDNRRFEHR
jgi:hypothetical protein